MYGKVLSFFFFFNRCIYRMPRKIKFSNICPSKVLFKMNFLFALSFNLIWYIYTRVAYCLVSWLLKQLLVEQSKLHQVCFKPHRSQLLEVPADWIVWCGRLLAVGFLFYFFSHLTQYDMREVLVSSEARNWANKLENIDFHL